MVDGIKCGAVSLAATGSVSEQLLLSYNSSLVLRPQPMCALGEASPLPAAAEAEVHAGAKHQPVMPLGHLNP
jgi:hypothetical protein